MLFYALYEIPNPFLKNKSMQIGSDTFFPNIGYILRASTATGVLQEPKTF